MFDVVATVVGSAAVFAPFLMVVGIVWVRSKAQIEEKRIAAAAERDRTGASTQDTGRIEELEDRVRVLERIVTDGGYDLATRIEALRDARPLEPLTEARDAKGLV